MMSRTRAVTILFCDLVASTERRARLGDDAYDEFSQRFMSALRRAIDQTGGHEVSSAGDGLMVVFPESVADAIACAAAMHGGVAHIDAVDRPQLRIGISCGEVAQEGTEYSGMPIVEAARLEAAAGPGQTFATSVARSLVGTRRAFRFRDVGLLALKGLPEPLATVEIIHDDISEHLEADESSTSGIDGPANVALSDLRRAVPISDSRPQMATRVRSAPIATFLADEHCELLARHLSADEFTLLQPSEVSLDTHYSIGIHVSDTQLLCTTSLSATRVYPGAHEVFWSACSDQDSLDAEFAAHSDGCLSREEASSPEDDSVDDWVDRARRLEVSLVLGGREARSREPYRRRLERNPSCAIVRHPFDPGALAQSLTRFSLTATFPLHPDETHFPVEFNSYWCVGTTEVHFQVHGRPVRAGYRSHLASASDYDIVRPTPSSVVVQMAKETVLRRPAGIDFFWRAT